MLSVRYLLPAAVFLAGFVLLAIEPNTTGLEGFFMCAGAALSILFVNVLFRAGAQGDLERETEAEARAYYAEHGRWPDEDEPDRRA